MSKEALIRVRMSARDAHYGGNLVPGAKMLEIFGDLITDLAIQQDGDEGLFRAYHSVDFLEPVYSGDFIEAKGRIVKLGNTSRRCEFEAYKVIAVRTDVNDSAADVLKEPILVCKAEGTTVVPAEMKRV
jgi:3-aminobutyryl-CoA ammonia-lyase